MNRRNELENIIIGSCLLERDYIRETAIIQPELIQDPLSRRIFELLPSTTGTMPLADIIHNAAAYGYDIAMHACRLSLNDFYYKRFQYNTEAVIDKFIGKPSHNITNVQFRDYVSQFIKYAYADRSRTPA